MYQRLKDILQSPERVANNMHVHLAIRGFDLPVNARKFTDETEFQKEERL